MSCLGIHCPSLQAPIGDQTPGAQGKREAPAGVEEQDPITGTLCAWGLAVQGQVQWQQRAVASLRLGRLPSWVRDVTRVDVV